MNPIIKQWLDETSTVKNGDIGEKYTYRNSVYIYSKAGEALTAGKACYVKVQATATSDGEIWETDQATAGTRAKFGGIPVASVASGSYFWRKVQGPREYKPNQTDFLDPAIVCDTVTDATAIMPSATTDGRMEDIGAVEHLRGGVSYAAGSANSLASYYINALVW